MRYIKSGIDSGATLETGGDRLGKKGYYIQPTVFSNVKVFVTPQNMPLYSIVKMPKNDMVEM